MPKFIFLWTDVFVYCLIAGMLLYGWKVSRTPGLRKAWSSVARTSSAMCAAMVLGAFLLVGLLDSIHYRPLMPPAQGTEAAQPVYSPVRSEERRVGRECRSRRWAVHEVKNELDSPQCVRRGRRGA